jgi:hypothetical protein
MKKGILAFALLTMIALPASSSLADSKPGFDGSPWPTPCGQPICPTQPQ